EVVGELTETATISGDVIDTNPANNTASETTEVDPAADLAVQIASSVPVAGIGLDFQYVVTAINNGPIPATGVVLSDSLPSGVSFVSATADQGAIPTQTTSGGVSVTFGTLGVGDSASLTIVVDPTASPGSTLVDSASVAGQQPDPNLSNNDATLNLNVQNVSDLSVTATAQASGGTPLAGQPLTYTITVSNLGPADEPDAILSGSLPPGVTVDSAIASQGATPTVTQGLLAADLGLLPANATATVTLVVSPGATDIGTMTAGFTVLGQNIDPDPSNNAAQVTVDVAPATDLSVAIAPGSAQAVAQIDWTYTVDVTNPGPSAATGVTATSLLPTDVTFVSASSSMGTAPTVQDGTITADMGALAAGGSATLTIVVLPAPAAAIDGSIVLAAAVAGNQADPDPDAEQASLTVPVVPSVNLTVTLAATPEAIQSGRTITFTATVTNRGTTPATDVSLMLPSVAGLVYGSPSPSQGTAALAEGQSVARFGTLNPGASVTFTEVAMATTAGSFTQSATLSDAQYNLDAQGATASVTAVVQESAGTVQFGAANISVNNVAGVAVIPVVRLYGTAGSITVNYETVAVDATPGLDYVATAGTLTLGPGQSSASISIPVLNDIYENHDDLVNIVLSDPSGGAVLGGVTASSLQIVDTDPDVTPPQVTGLTWAGSSQAISNVTLTFSAPLDPTFATNPANYQLEDLARGVSVGIASISYNPSTFAVTVVPSSPLPSGEYDQIQVDGTGATAIRDLAGNLLSGNSSGAAGSNYVASFAQGTRLQYVDNAGNLVKLRIKGAGYLEQVRNASGEGVLLDIVGMIPHRTTLTGSIKVRKRSSGQTELGTIQGLGQFGDVRVLLKSPPFRVAQLPFQRRGVGVL
ncbi:MAG: Calx-beta domain-containing protein, partial [Isosphaeraceae bacterium]